MWSSTLCDPKSEKLLKKKKRKNKKIVWSNTGSKQQGSTLRLYSANKYYSAHNHIPSEFQEICKVIPPSDKLRANLEVRRFYLVNFGGNVFSQNPGGMTKSCGGNRPSFYLRGHNSSKWLCHAEAEMCKTLMEMWIRGSPNSFLIQRKADEGEGGIKES